MALNTYELRADASKKYDEAEAILTSEAPSAEDVAKATTLKDEAEALEARADAADKIATRKAALGASAVSRPAIAKTEDRSEEQSVEVREAQAFRNYLVTGDKAEIRSLNTLTPESGGVFVPTTLSNAIIDVIAASGPMLSGRAGYVWNSATGNDFDIPRGDDRDGVAYEVAEAADHPDTEFDFDKVRFGAIEYGTGIVAISQQMKRDGTYDLNGYVTRKFGSRLANTLNTRLTYGNGTTQPQGLVVGLKAASRLVTTAASTGFAFNDLMAAEENIDEAYLENAVWMVSRKQLNKLRTLATTAGDPVIWQGRYTDATPTTILGRSYVVNNKLADDEMVLGHLPEAYWIRQIGGLSIKTSQEVFFRKNMEGVAGFASYDAKVVNPAAAVVLKVKAA